MIEYSCRALLFCGRAECEADGAPITFPVGAQLTGYRLRDIHVRLTPAEFIDPRVRAWMLEVVLPRRASAAEPVHVELGGM